MERRLASVEKGVAVVAVDGNVDRALPARDCLNHKVDDSAVAVGFGAQKSRTDRALVMTDVSGCHKRGRQGDYLSSSDIGIESVVEIVPVGGVLAKVRHRMGIGVDEPRGESGDHKRGYPIVAVRQSYRKHPDVLLVLEKI